MLIPTLHQIMSADYRCTPASIARAKTEAAKERAEVAAEQQEETLRTMNGIDALTILVDDFGAKRVQSWLSSLAALRGQSL